MHSFNASLLLTAKFLSTLWGVCQHSTCFKSHSDPEHQNSPLILPLWETLCFRGTKRIIGGGGWPEMRTGCCPHSRLSSCNPASYRTCSQKLPPWVASRHSLWLVLQWGHTSQSCPGARDTQRGPKGSSRMWIHPPLTSLPIGERCV